VGGMDIEPAVLAEPDVENADSLVSSNDPDDMANEQTWPTEEEMGGGTHPEDSSIPDASNGTTPRAVKRVPKGMSSYQATWIVDEEDDDEGDNVQNGDVEVEMDEAEDLEDVHVDEEMDSEAPRDDGFEDLDAEEEERQ
jgi:pre-rRNA-processing protein TSR1